MGLFQFKSSLSKAIQMPRFWVCAPQEHTRRVAEPWLCKRRRPRGFSDQHTPLITLMRFRFNSRPKESPFQKWVQAENYERGEGKCQGTEEEFLWREDASLKREGDSSFGLGWGRGWRCGNRFCFLFLCLHQGHCREMGTFDVEPEVASSLETCGGWKVGFFPLAFL